MSLYTLIVIIGTLMIIGGISLAGTPLVTFVSAGYFIIALFFIAGLIGILRAVHEKRYDKDFIFAILSLILGIAGLVTPGAPALNNYALLYMAAAWLFIHGALSIISAIASRGQVNGTLFMIIGIILGIIEIGLGVYSIAHPAVLAMNIGMLIGFYYIEQGFNTIIIGSVLCKGGNNLTLIFTVLGIITIIGGFSMMATPVSTFLSLGYAIILLFFMNGVIGVVRGFAEKAFDKKFLISILSLVLGIIGFSVPGIADMNSYLLLYLTAIYFFIHGVFTIIAAVDARRKGGSVLFMVLGIVLGVLELLSCILSVAYPVMLAYDLVYLIAFYFIESGFAMIFVGATVSRAVAIGRTAAEAARLSQK